MEKEVLFAAILGIILLIVIVQTVQLNIISAKFFAGVQNSGAQTSSPSTGAIDTSQMTENEKMNYEMHGVIPARFSSGSGSALQGLPNMVGGC